MAFDPKNKEIKKALHNEGKEAAGTERKDTSFPLPVFQENEYEKTKNFTFSLQPSVRKKMDDLAEQQGYNAASKFLNELIKSL